MKRDNIAQTYHLACKTYKIYNNNKANLNVYKFGIKIPKSANKITKKPRLVREAASYL